MKRIFAVCLFCGLLAFTLYWQAQLKRANSDAAANTSIQPDFIATGLTSVTFTAKGFKESQLKADYMEHYQSLDMTNFEKPLVYIYPNNGSSQWTATSAQGTFNTDTQVLSLSNQVIIQAIEPNEPIQSLSSQYLELNLDTMIISSQRKVDIYGSNYHLTGVGLYGDLEANYIDLKQQVNGTYEAQ
ncbi:LPS export ABC transporter periplasmic protein LptC [Paraferrimonas sp. SM1919]|uniref:LPS export ABC transporter periplasmic protein LptC n=1 Tax=Paraferrimonas sp. SM1919 TaxID=2662263 RepID=UPI0013CF42EA|nr:LPS export ABC transporter periplasmic protein LptC [Paraferrimonas sp. SM1919]